MLLDVARPHAQPSVALDARLKERFGAANGLMLLAFDLLKLDGDDLRGLRLEYRKERLSDS